jgi:hypothetical protein
MPKLTITEDPIKYLSRELVNGTNTLYVRKNNIFYNICPPNYDVKINVSNDMSNVTIDNNIANIRYLFYTGTMPIWPNFINGRPIIRWTSELLLYFSETYN